MVGLQSTTALYTYILDCLKLSLELQPTSLRLKARHLSSSAFCTRFSRLAVPD